MVLCNTLYLLLPTAQRTNDRHHVRKQKQSHTPAQDDSQANQVTTEELARFRAEWKADLNNRLKQTWGGKPEPSQEASAPSSTGVANEDVGGTAELKRPAKPILSPTLPDAGFGTVIADALHPAQARALEIYRKAVAHEQRSELDEALRLYRQAFRINEDVARLYERLEYQSLHIKRVDGSRLPHHHAPVDSAVGHLAQGLENVHVSSDASGGLAVTLPANHGVVTGTLASVMAAWDPLALEFPLAN